MPTTQRLVVCLDGTWNRQDSSTNVLHHFNLVREGVVPGTEIVQKRFYDQGVGTGVLDSITGGGFGFGLEANVRDAYNWLVESFREYDGDQIDEIYVFGFSRGAYTARSLVGFIAQCGLLRRGAPITVEQLWSTYCLLGRQKEGRESVWEKILGKEDPTVRAYTDLQRAKNLTSDEKLLLDWSRRANIRYLGIYDTVGAIGWDSLAIPGLTSKLALHNNVRPTTLIQHCRHALALDEHRSNFNHTPFLAYLEEGAEEMQRVDARAERTIDQHRAMWRGKIEQRWFVGAHSNIGGGYANNRLAQRPLEWIMAGATQLGLQCEPLPKAVSVTAAESQPRDSYAEFAPPLWETIIRNKRNFRIIDPALKLRARKSGTGLGFALETINEVIDESVTDYWKNSGSPISPNLECYFKRKKLDIPPGSKHAEHAWMREMWFSYTALVVWTITAVFGAYALDRLGGFTALGLPFWFAWGIAFFLPFLDWAESKVTFRYAVGAGGPRARAFLDAVYWTRTLGFLLFVFGAVYGICLFFAAGLRQEWPVSFDALSEYAIVPLLAALPAVLITKARSKFAWLAFVGGPVVIALIAGLLFVVGATVRALFTGATVQQFWGGSGTFSLPGWLLLLQLFGIYFWRSFLWVAEPLAQANLGSIPKLQLCPTPQRVTKCLNDWRDRLANTKQPDPSPSGLPAAELRDILRHALWRDIIGFIPVYTLFLLFSLKFATLVPFEHWAALIAWIPVNGLAAAIRPALDSLAKFWWVLPLLAAAGDYLEDICHLQYCKLYENEPKRAAPSAGLTMFAFLMTLIKDVSFVTAGVITTLAVFAGTHAMLPEVADWRAKVAIVLSGLGAAGVVLMVAAMVSGMVRKRTSRADMTPPLSKAAGR